MSIRRLATFALLGLLCRPSTALGWQCATPRTYATLIRVSEEGADLFFPIGAMAATGRPEDILLEFAVVGDHALIGQESP